MDLFNLATELEQVEVHRRVKLFEATTMDAITYLPVHVGAVRARLKDLSKKKWKWGLEILEDDDENRDVRIEDELRILVPKEHWVSFQEMFTSEIDNDSYLNLKELLNEALEDDLKKLRSDLKPALVEMFSEQRFPSMEKTIRIWTSRFGTVRYITDKHKVSVTFEHEAKDIQKLCGALLRAYGDDKGGLEMLLNDIQGKRPLGAYDVFKKYDHLYGTRIHSELHDVTMIFEAIVDMTFMLAQSIHISDEDVLDRVEEDLTSVKRVGNVLYPVGELFPASFFGSLEDIIEDVSEEGEEREE